MKRTISFSVLSLILLSLSFAANAASTPSASDSEKMVEAIFSGNQKQIAALKKKGVSMDALSSNDMSGLMQLSDEGRLAEVKKTIAAGAKADAVNSNGENALFTAAYSGHVDVAEYLMSKGAKADRVSKSSKECALHAAVKSEQLALAKKLKAAAPKCLIQKNSDGKTPADLAKELGNDELAKLLKP